MVPLAADDELKQIRSERRSASHRYRLTLSEAAWLARFLGAWQGRRLGAAQFARPPAPALQDAVQALRVVETSGPAFAAGAVDRLGSDGPPVGGLAGDAGALERSDVWGWLAPGWPELAAELAYRAARPRAGGEALYGGMFAAALASAAFVAADPAEAIHIGAGEVPDSSRLAAAIRQVFAWRRQGVDPPAALERVQAEYGAAAQPAAGASNPVASATRCAIALLYGGGEWKATLALCPTPLIGGWIGALRGVDALPGEELRHLSGAVHTGPAGSPLLSVTDLAQRTLAAARQVLAGNA